MLLLLDEHIVWVSSPLPGLVRIGPGRPLLHLIHSLTAKATLFGTMPSLGLPGAPFSSAFH